MPLPKHQNPITLDRTACAPYNFVELPNSGSAALAPNDMPVHNTLVGLTGYFDVTLTTKTPLYVRCGLKRERFERGDANGSSFRDQIKNTPEFFHTKNELEPILPGSSLRGMLRSYFEVITHSKLQRLSEVNLFFRTVDTSSVGTTYRERMSETPTPNHHKALAKAGFWKQSGDSYGIQPCEYARVEVRMLQENLSNSRHGREVWVQLDAQAQYHNHSQGKQLYYRKVLNITDISDVQPLGWHKGIIIRTGSSPRQHMAFIFLTDTCGTTKQVKNSGADENDHLVERFHSDDQLTQYQKQTFHGDGKLRDNDPIFYLEGSGTISFFGRAQMFRLPYKNTPKSLLPNALCTSKEIDYAEAVFGYVRDKQHNAKAKSGNYGRALAGRVYITDGECQQLGQDAFLNVSNMPSGVLTPKILASPKPTSFQHYIVQETPSDSNELAHYDSKKKDDRGRETQENLSTLRGNKFYWHQARVTAQSLSEPNHVGNNDTQHTQMKPVRANISFTFRVYFENLLPEELGALSWTLQPPTEEGKDYCHKLGMGKPYGMGSVKLEATLHLQNTKKRYENLFAENGWDEEEETDFNLSDVITKFEQDILGQFDWEGGRSAESLRLSETYRIRQLLNMMDYNSPLRVEAPEPGYENFEANRVLQEGNRDKINARYMTISLPPHPDMNQNERREFNKNANEYKKRPVLPEPLWEKFGGSKTGIRDIIRLSESTRGDIEADEEEDSAVEDDITNVISSTQNVPDERTVPPIQPIRILPPEPEEQTIECYIRMKRDRSTGRKTLTIKSLDESVRVESTQSAMWEPLIDKAYINAILNGWVKAEISGKMIGLNISEWKKIKILIDVI
jgi:CRISPR-associated protein (TIGR03986 family)